MGRDLTENIIQALTPTGSDGGLVLEDPHVGVDIVLRDPVATPLHWATGGGLQEVQATTLNVMGVSVTYGPILYLPHLRDVPDLRLTQGHAPDGGVFTAQNLDSQIGELVGGLEAVFNKAKIAVHFLFKKLDGTYEADTLLVGLITGVRGNTALCSFTVTSDMNDRGALVASRSLTQRCSAVYKGPQCRYYGPEPTCSHVKEDAVNGCRAKGWEFAFWGANFKVVLPAQGTGFDHDDGDGTGPGGGGRNFFGPGGRGGTPIRERPPVLGQ